MALKKPYEPPNQKVKRAGRFNAILCTAALLAGLLGDFIWGIDLFARSGAVLVAIALAFYFLMGKAGFFTGFTTNNIDNINHGNERSWLALIEAILLFDGTIVRAFGDWITGLLKYWNIECFA